MGKKILSGPRRHARGHDWGSKGHSKPEEARGRIDDDVAWVRWSIGTLRIETIEKNCDYVG